MADFSSNLPVGLTGLNLSNVPTYPINADSTGNLLVHDVTAGPVTSGSAAAYSALIGGQYNATLPTLTTGQQSAIQIDSTGRIMLSPSSPIPTGVADGSVFTYGTTIQQIIGGVYQDTSPTLTAGQQGAVRLTQYRGQHVNVRTSGGIEITAASNGNAGNEMLHVQIPDTTTASTALGALNATVSIAMAGLSSVGFQIAAGTFIGTLTPQSSIDGGTTWTTASFYNPSNSTVVSALTFASANMVTVLSVLPIGGASNVRVIVTAYTSGTANAVMRASMVTGAAGAITSAAFGTVNNTYVTLTANTTTQLLAANTNRRYAYISNNSGGLISIQFGSATGLTSAQRGLVIPNGDFYELKGDNLYTGAVFAYTNSSGLVIAVTEGTP